MEIDLIVNTVFQYLKNFYLRLFKTMKPYNINIVFKI